LAGGLKTVDDCLRRCTDDSTCTAIDWVTGAPVGMGCWLYGSWSMEEKASGYTGVVHYAID